jgi:hypothetical protein
MFHVAGDEVIRAPIAAGSTRAHAWAWRSSVAVHRLALMQRAAQAKFVRAY